LINNFPKFSDKLLFIFLVFCVVLSCVFTFWVRCCDVRYDFRIKRCSVRLYIRLFVGGIMSYLRYLCLFTHSGVQHILCCFLFCFVCLRLVLCWQFLWIVHFWLPLRYSLTSIMYIWFQQIDDLLTKTIKLDISD
jgi:hypothetical protein